MALTVRRCIEQWILWCIINSVSIFMWARAAMNNGPDVMIVMWSLWFVNSIIFLVQWVKATRQQAN
jgi:nicotinamide mononucleotide transporter